VSALRSHDELLRVIAALTRFAIAPASSVRPACINRFFFLNIALTAGVTNCGSVDVTVI